MIRIEVRWQKKKNRRILSRNKSLNYKYKFKFQLHSTWATWSQQPARRQRWSWSWGAVKEQNGTIRKLWWSRKAWWTCNQDTLHHGTSSEICHQWPCTLYWPQPPQQVAEGRQSIGQASRQRRVGRAHDNDQIVSQVHSHAFRPFAIRCRG